MFPKHIQVQPSQLGWYSKSKELDCTSNSIKLGTKAASEKSYLMDRGPILRCCENFLDAWYSRMICTMNCVITASIFQS
jgi:hypothetical protein